MLFRFHLVSVLRYYFIATFLAAPGAGLNPEIYLGVLHEDGSINNNPSCTGVICTTFDLAAMSCQHFAPSLDLLGGFAHGVRARR